MKNIKLLITQRGLEKLKVLMEEWYLTECIVNNSSEVDAINIINKPTILKTLKDLVYFVKDNLKEYDIEFLQLSLKELKNNKQIPYCYILSDNNKVFSVVENNLSYEQINEQQRNIDIELEEESVCQM